ncbi:MAG: DUF1559 domain-containing protein [Singulisphaera sp.]
MALHNYHDATLVPPGRMQPYVGFRNGSGVCWRGGLAVHMFILPFMEQTNLSNAFNYSVSRIRPADGCSTNGTVAVTQLAAWLCPSDNNPQSAGNPVNNYRSNMGATICMSSAWEDNGADLAPWSTICSAEIGGPRGGVFTDRTTSFATITDGTSNTAAFSERMLGDLEATKVGPAAVKDGPVFRGSGAARPREL